MPFQTVIVKTFNGYPALAQYIGLPHATKPQFQRKVVYEHVDDIREWIKEAIAKHSGNVGWAAIVIAVFEGVYYIVDGQHRLRAIYLHSRKSSANVHFIVQFQPVDTMADMLQLFQNHHKGMTITAAEVDMSSLSGRQPSEDSAQDKATRIAAQRAAWIQDDIQDDPTLARFFPLDKRTKLPYQARPAAVDEWVTALPLADNIQGPGDFRRTAFVTSEMIREEMGDAGEAMLPPLVRSQCKAETKVAQKEGIKPFWLGVGHKRYFERLWDRHGDLKAGVDAMRAREQAAERQQRTAGALGSTE